MELLQQHKIKHCVVAIGYERDMSGLTIRVGDNVLTDQDYDAYDHLTGEIPLQHITITHPQPCSCSCNCARSVELTSGANMICSLPSCCCCPKQKPQATTVPKGRLFGGGIAFPQDLIDGGGNREPWVGFKRSVEQVDLMMDVFLSK